MGRRVYCGGEFVWKYWFAIQASNQADIVYRLGVGEIYGRKTVQVPLQVRHVLDDEEPGWDDVECPIDEADCGDVLLLKHEDVPKMREWLKANKKEFYNPRFLASMQWDEVEKNKHKMERMAFWCMVEAYANYIDGYPDEEEFWFDGEY